MKDLADRLDAAVAVLATVDRAVPGLTVPPGVLGADDAGVPGRVGRELHARWTAALDARAREAADAAARLSELAGALRATERDYADTDDQAARRVERSS